jgi:hypothetical protein
MSPLFFQINLDGTIHTGTFFDTINPFHWLVKAETQSKSASLTTS